MRIRGNVIVFFLAAAMLFLTACEYGDGGIIEFWDSKFNEYIGRNVSDEASELISPVIVENSVSENSTESSNNISENTVAAGEDEESLFVPFNQQEAFSYCDALKCTYDKAEDNIIFELSFKDKIPESDDDYIYLFEVATFETYDLTGKYPISSKKKNKEMSFLISYEETYLFAGFVPAIRYEGEFVALYYGQCISNPEAMAENTEVYPKIESKKGLLVDAKTIGTDRLNDLNVRRAVYNIPISYIMGKSENANCPTEKFEYNGETYYFNTYRLRGFDSVFKDLTEEGYYCTAIILNDWNRKYPEIIHPLSRRKTQKSEYYAFNTEEEAGVRLMEATALFLAKRYSGGEYGMVYDWVIANEINQQKIWNYMDTNDLSYYVESFEKAFRTFYCAIKSEYSNAKIYFSIDQCWNNNKGMNSKFFNGKDLLMEFNEDVKRRGDYDWGISIHPYPDPLTKTKFWEGNFSKSIDSPVITPMNLSAFTDFMLQNDYLATNGSVRDIAVTELGFSSKPGEQLQAAAVAYCYYIIEDNDYINSFLLNRQTDDTQSLKSGLALGIFNRDYSRKYLFDVFRIIDTDESIKYIPELMDMLGSESLEEALEWAR